MFNEKNYFEEKRENVVLLLTRKKRHGMIHKVLLYTDSCRSVVLTGTRAIKSTSKAGCDLQHYFFAEKRTAWMCGLEY